MSIFDTGVFILWLKISFSQRDANYVSIVTGFLSQSNNLCQDLSFVVLPLSFRLLDAGVNLLHILFFARGGLGDGLCIISRQVYYGGVDDTRAILYGLCLYIRVSSLYV
jgi:hypothetical protein